MPDPAKEEEKLVPVTTTTPLAYSAPPDCPLTVLMKAPFVRFSGELLQMAPPLPVAEQFWRRERDEVAGLEAHKNVADLNKSAPCSRVEAESDRARAPQTRRSRELPTSSS